MAEEEENQISRAKQGDVDCFNRLVEKYQTQAYNLALRMLGNHYLADEATWDAFFKVWTGIHSFKGRNFKAWVLCIVANSCRDQLRKGKRNHVIALEIDLCASSDESPEEYALRQELGEEIQKGLNSLHPDQRLAIILRDMQGLSYEEISQVMNCSLGTVKSRLSRGREGLRDHLVSRELLGARFRLK